MLPLRDYQIACRDAVLARWGHAPWHDGETETFRSLIANLATSAGKTIIAADLARIITEDLGGRVLFVADREELIQQPVEKFYKACGIISGIHRGQDRASVHADVVVASIQTLARRLPPGRPFTHIIDDEAHRGTDQRAKVHEAYPDAKVLGITATAFRKGLADLSKWYQSVAFELGTFDLIDQGYITPINVLTMPLEVDISRVHQAQGDFDQGEVDTILEPYYDAVALAIKQHASGRSILAFLPLIKSSQAFVRVLISHGINAVHCDGSTHDRQGVIEAFESGKFQVLSNSQVFSTGVDFIRADCLLNLSPTRSRGEYRQRAGRIMRVIPGTIDGLPTAESRRAAIAASGKPDCLILDLLWQTSKIGLAGPASLLAATEEDEQEIGERVKKQRTPEELQQISREVQKDREQRLRDALERAAAEQARKDHRKAVLVDVRQLALNLGTRDLINYEPVTPWEKAPATGKQAEMLEAIGVNPDTATKGYACKVLDAVFARQTNGMAPLEAFDALKAAGVERPQDCSLDDAIRLLRDGFPMTFGKKYRGRSLANVPHSFWNWLGSHDARTARQACEAKHPAAWRYYQHVVRGKRQPEPELALT